MGSQVLVNGSSSRNASLAKRAVGNELQSTGHYGTVRPAEQTRALQELVDVRG